MSTPNQAGSMPVKDRIREFRLRLPCGRRVPVGVGCAWVGRKGPDAATMKSDVELLLSCYRSGFRFFDSARAYGDSEIVLGEFLKEVPREEVFVATKAKFESGQEDFETFKRSYFESFERLGVDHIDCFQIHECLSYEPCVPDVIPFLVEQREKGAISCIGMGTRSVNTLEVAARSGYFNSVLSYQNYSLLKKSAHGLIDCCAHHGVAFYNASALHFGMITAPETAGVDAKYCYRRRHQVLSLELRKLCERIGVNVVAAAIQFSLFNPGIDMLLNGIKQISDLESTLAALNTAIYPEQWAAITELQERDPYLYVQDDIVR